MSSRSRAHDGASGATTLSRRRECVTDCLSGQYHALQTTKTHWQPPTQPTPIPSERSAKSECTKVRYGWLRCGSQEENVEVCSSLIQCHLPKCQSSHSLVGCFGVVSARYSAGLRIRAVLVCRQ